MDDLADKLKQVFSFGRQKKFQGSGQRLGTSAEAPHIRVNRGQSGQPRAPDLARAAELEKKLAAVRQHQPIATQEGGAGFNPFQASTVSGNAFTTAVQSKPSSSDAQPSPKPAQKPSAAPGPSTSSARPPAVQLPSAPAVPAGIQGYEVDDATVDMMQQHLVQVASTSGAAQSLTTLQKILSNILKSPGEPKYRQVKMTNPKIREAIVDVPGALEFMAACGFEVTFVKNAAGAEEGVVVFPEDGNLPHLQEGLQIIQLIQGDMGTTPQPTATSSSSPATSTPSSPYPNATSAPAPSSSAPTPTAPSIPVVHASTAKPGTQTAGAEGITAGAIAAAGAGLRSQSVGSTVPAAVVPTNVDRQTRVVLPVTPDTQLPDWFFKRTPADLKGQYMSALKKREQNSVLTTRAYKERMAAANTGPRPTHALIRIRFPEGVHLQGRFAAEEPVTAVHSWLESSLSHAGALEYELVDHNRKPLQLHGTVRSADLMPTALLSLRILQSGASKQSSVLSDAALRNAVVGDE